LFHAGGWADRQTDMMKLIETFCGFVNMPKNEITKQAHYTYMVSLNCLLGKWQGKRPSHYSLASFVSRRKKTINTGYYNMLQI
jgi:hypothetical protein